MAVHLWAYIHGSLNMLPIQEGGIALCDSSIELASTFKKKLFLFAI